MSVNWTKKIKFKKLDLIHEGQEALYVGPKALSLLQELAASHIAAIAASATCDATWVNNKVGCIAVIFLQPTSTRRKIIILCSQELINLAKQKLNKNKN